ncbi:MAG: TonB-dependent receptor, partial [Myxococcales bacterium]
PAPGPDASAPASPDAVARQTPGDPPRAVPLIARPGVIDLDESLTAQRPGEVQVRGTPRSTLARGMTTLDQDDLRVPAPQSLADALRYQGGVAVQQTSPGQSTIYLRGLSGREVLHLVDGVRVNATLFRAGNNPYLALIDPYSLARLELVRGPSSVLHGSDALGGAVIGTTRLPAYADRGHTLAAIHQTFGSNPFGTATRADLEHQERTWAVHLGLTHYGAGDIRTGGGERSPIPSSWSGLERPVGGAYAPVTSRYERGTAFDQYAADAALRLRLAHDLDLVLRTSTAYRPELGRYDEITPRFKRDYPASADSALRPLTRWTASATLSDRRTELPYDELLVTLSWQRLDERLRRRGWDESCVDDVDPCTTRLRLTPSSRLRRETNISDAFGLRTESRWSWARRRLAARLGAEVHHDRVQSASSSVRTNATGDAITPDPSRYPDGSSQTQAGLFGQLDLDLTPRLHVHAGARAALFALAIRERVGDDPSPAFSSTLLDGTFSAGLRWEFAPHVALVATAGRAVRAPNVQDFASLGPRAGDRFQLPNGSIRPEHSLGADVGLRARLHRFRADLTAFALRYQDAIVLAPAT